MGDGKNVFQKYRVCLILSVMAVVLVVFALLFLKREEPLIEETPESIEVTDVYKVESENLQPQKESGEQSDIMPESEVLENPEVTIVTEEMMEPETEQELVKEPVADKEQEVSKGKTEIIPEKEEGLESLPIPEEPTEQEPVPEHIPQEEQEPGESPDEEPENPPSKEPEVSCHHSWVFESFYQEPTCGNGGLENQVCAHCGETLVTGGTPTGEHSYCVEVPGDCCSEEVVVCSECNHREIKEKDMGNHMDVEDGFCYGCGTIIK